MVAEPVAGYPSKKAAILAMLDEGLDDAEIVQRTGSTLLSVAQYRSQSKAPGTLTVGQRDKAARILVRAIPVIAQAINCSPRALYAAMKRIPLRFDQPEPEFPAQKAVEAKPGAADLDGDHFTDTSNMVEEITSQPSVSVADSPKTPSEEIDPKPEEPPVLVVAQQRAVKLETIAGQCYLKNKTTGAYLHFSGQMLTMEKSHRWRGTAQQAKAMRQQSAVAKALTLVSAVPMAPTGARL